MNKRVQNTDFYRTYPIMNAVRSQLMMPEESNVYRIDGECRYATPVGSYVHCVTSGYKHIIPPGLEIQKQLGGVKYE